MKARMMIKCGRCGYQYDPANPDKPLLQFVGKDERVYTACADCLTELAKIEDENEKTDFIKSFGGVEK